MGIWSQNLLPANSSLRIFVKYSSGCVDFYKVDVYLIHARALNTKSDQDESCEPQGLPNDVTKFFLFIYIKSIKMYGNKFI
jgi:hypothetical protein